MKDSPVTREEVAAFLVWRDQRIEKGRKRLSEILKLMGVPEPVPQPWQKEAEL